MKPVLRKYTMSFLLYGCFLLSGILLAAAIPRLDLHIMMNSHHTEFLDNTFKIMTFLGSGWFAVCLTFLFVLIRYRYALMVLSSFLASGLLVQLLKRFLFPGALRPSAFLDQMPDVDLVAGIALHRHFSFPSGHSATAFAVLLLAGFISGRNWAAFMLMLLAWLVSLSRVYLSQHFLIDVLAGSLPGLLSALFFYWYFQGMNKQWLDRSLFNIR